MSNRYRHRRSAFTLIELLLVLVILAVLAGIVIPKFAGRSDQARATAAKTQITSFETAIDAFYLDNNDQYPTNEQGLEALTQTSPKGTPAAFKSIPNDPWGRPYVYKNPGTHNDKSYDVYSLGKDGVEGNDDIGNWPEGK
jgi:general secretion pathway protein G